MTKKTWQTRWDDTIDYLDKNFPAPLPGDMDLGEHIHKKVVPSPTLREKISKQLSLGWRKDGEDDPGYVTKTNQRLALRALLLCQRVYYSDDTWAEQSEDGPGLHVIPLPGLLSKNWKERSLQHWKTKSEADIKEAIRMFVVDPAATPSDLSDIAQAGPPNGVSLPGNLTCTRASKETYGSGIICYVGVQGWLVRSGIVSMRWFMSNSAPNKEVGCNRLFGEGRLVWNAKLAEKDKPEVRRIISGIPKGSVIHIWSPQNYNWNGHWVIYNGDGTICGVNNGEFLAKDAEKGIQVKKNYTNHSTLFEQFWCYGGEGESEGKKTAMMAVIDPLTMPNRI